MNEIPTAAARTLTYETPASLSPTFATMLGLVFTRLLGLYFIVQAVVTGPTLLYWAWNGTSGGTPGGSWSASSLLLYAGVPIAYAATGVWLFARAPRIANRMFANVTHDGGAPSSHELFTLIVAGVGLLTLVLSLNQVFNTLSSLLIAMQNIGAVRSRGSTSIVELSTILNYISALAQPVAGLFLFLRADAFVRFAKRRYDDRAAAKLTPSPPRSPAPR